MMNANACSLSFLTVPSSIASFIAFFRIPISRPALMENKSIITIEGTDTFRVVDNSSLLDNKGNFNVPTGTLTLKGNVYTAGAMQPEKLFSLVELRPKKTTKFLRTQIKTNIDKDRD